MAFDMHIHLSIGGERGTLAEEGKERGRLAAPPSAGWMARACVHIRTQ